MNPIFILLHIGSLLQILKDAQQGISDVVHGKLNKTDADKLIEDLITLINDGILPLPAGTTKDAVIAALKGLETVINS